MPEGPFEELGRRLWSGNITSDGSCDVDYTRKKYSR